VSDSTLASLPIITVDSAPPAAPPQSRRLPPWLRQNLAPGGGHAETAHLIAELGLETVCSSAKCPNRLECWSSRTATFMILGNVCTRPCGFCSVPRGKTEALELDEPERVAEAARRLSISPSQVRRLTRAVQREDVDMEARTVMECSEVALPSVRIGDRVLIDPADLDRYVKELRR
jgi:lipoic acid synthetase